MKQLLYKKHWGKKQETRFYLWTITLLQTNTIKMIYLSNVSESSLSAISVLIESEIFYLEAQEANRGCTSIWDYVMVKLQ